MIDVPRLLDELGVDARRRGREWWGRCPAHDEKTPSWSISDSPGSELHGSHHCFGCHFGGGPVDLVKEVKNLSWDDADDWIESHGLRTEDVAPLDVEIQIEGGLDAPFRLPPSVCDMKFERWPAQIRDYVLSRDITVEQAKRWRLMFVTDGRLTGRVVFPIDDERGIVRSYTARSFDGRNPRYKTPRESEHSDPGAIFGSRYWRGKGGQVVVTEGAINGLAFERVGVRRFGALGGSTVSNEQILTLSMFDEVFIATDSDVAGETIADEISTSLVRWKKIRRVRFTAGVDAQELDPEGLVELLRESGYSDWADVPV